MTFNIYFYFIFPLDECVEIQVIMSNDANMCAHFLFFSERLLKQILKNASRFSME